MKDGIVFEMNRFCDGWILNTMPQKLWNKYDEIPWERRTVGIRFNIALSTMSAISRGASTIIAVSGCGVSMKVPLIMRYYFTHLKWFWWFAWHPCGRTHIYFVFWDLKTAWRLSKILTNWLRHYQPRYEVYTIW